MSTQNITDYKLWPAVANENGITGCTLAHKQIVQWAKDNNDPAVWIMEDDVMFTAPGATEYFLKGIPRAFFIYTAGIYGTHKLIEKYTSHWYPSSMSGTHCYIIDSSFYNRFLDLDEAIPLDVAISANIQQKPPVHGCGIVLRHPMCALQIPGYSDILKQQVDYNNDRYLWQYELFKG